jgi:3-phenylpropionate/cinnamic acid dioxygenase small subunit
MRSFWQQLRQVAGEWKLARRIILLDQTTVTTHNLSVFL